MLIALIIGIAAGVCGGLLSHLVIPAEWSVYVAMGILALVDSLLGAIHAQLSGNYHNRRFLLGILGNFFLAIFLLYLGEQMGLDLTLAISVVFALRIFNNFSRIIQQSLQMGNKRVRIKEMAQHIAVSAEDRPESMTEHLSLEDKNDNA